MQAFEVAGNGGEVDLAGGASTSLRRAFGDPAPSHLAQPIASFPCAEDFLDAAPHAVDGLVPGFELCQRWPKIILGRLALGIGMDAPENGRDLIPVDQLPKRIESVIYRNVQNCPRAGLLKPLCFGDRIAGAQ